MIAWFVGIAHAEIAFEGRPRDGVETTITVLRDGEPGTGETVRVVARPGLAGSREIAVGITDGRGRVRWTPQGAGLVTVRAGDETLPVLVEAVAIPPSTGLLGAVLAATTVALLLAGFLPRRSAR